jgi:hypothetical protein
LKRFALTIILLVFVSISLGSCLIAQSLNSTSQKSDVYPTSRSPAARWLMGEDSEIQQLQSTTSAALSDWTADCELNRHHRSCGHLGGLVALNDLCNSINLSTKGASSNEIAAFRTVEVACGANWLEPRSLSQLDFSNLLFALVHLETSASIK